MCSDKAAVLPFRIKFTSAVTQFRKKPHERTSVKHRSPCRARTSHWFTECSSSHTWPGSSWTRSAAAPAQQIKVTSSRRLSWPFTLLQVGCCVSRVCWALWEGMRGSEVPSLSLAYVWQFPCVPGLSPPSQGCWWVPISDLIERNKNKPNHRLGCHSAKGCTFPSPFEACHVLAGESDRSRGGSSSQVLLPEAKSDLISAMESREHCCGR